MLPGGPFVLGRAHVDGLGGGHRGTGWRSSSSSLRVPSCDRSLSIIELSQDLPSAGWSLLLRASYLARPLPETYLFLGVTLGLSSDYDSEDRMVVTRYLAR